jgi:hypothetical protein
LQRRTAVLFVVGQHDCELQPAAAQRCDGSSPQYRRIPSDNTYQLMAAEKTSSKVEATKTWLKTKKARTTRWMGRQKKKLKQLAD